MISLGCAKNLVDSENMLGLLAEQDFSLVPTLEEAEIAIVNTCGFIQSAVEESIDTILEVAAHKKPGNLERLVVVGCFVQRYGYQLRKEMPEVDGWLGTGELSKIVNILAKETGPSPPFFINRPTFLADYTVPRVRATPFYSAYLKIAEGCSHRCSYCTIPRLRGPFRSRDLASLIIEAEHMIGSGVREINLIAQDTTMYGRDLGQDICLEDLMERLLQISGVEWIRMLYGHPLRISDRLLALMNEEEIICPYLDIPFQHVNETILKAMGRHYRGESPLQCIERIRSKTRRVSLRTTLIVGFPGETDEIFDELYHFVETAQFDQLGVFMFSPEKGTPAARLKGGVDRDVALKRVEAIMDLQAEISLRKNQGMIGHVEPVLIEGVSPETDLLLKGRMATMAPEVDSQVLINKGQGNVGEIVPVLIKEAHPYDLIGEIL